MRWKELQIKEAALSQSTDEKYIGAVNQLLKRDAEIRTGKNGESSIMPKSGQRVTSLSDPIYGSIDGEFGYVLVRHIFKSDELKNLTTGKAETELVFNKGEVAEGFHAAAAFSRLIKRPSVPITIKDVVSLISKLKNNKTYVLKRNEVESEIADEFHITIALKPGSWNSFQDPRVLEKMEKLLASIVSDANSETSRFADRFASNQRFDRVRVIGDGVSEETTKKTDVRFENEAEQKFADFSLKVGTTKQIHQVGSGGDSASPEERFNILQNGLFNVDGRFPLADISAAKNKFLKASDLVQAQEIAYKAALKSLNANLQSDNQEKEFLQNLVGALKYWLGRDDPDVKLKQFTETGTIILDPNLIDQLLMRDQLDLYAEWDSTVSLPKITIKDRVSGKSLVSFRTYKRESGYLRTYIEKEKLFVDLSLSKFIPNKPPKVPAAAEKTVPAVSTKPPVPAMRANAKPALAVSKPKIGAPVVPKGAIGTTPAPQAGIKPTV